MNTRRRLLWLWLAYLLFIFYSTSLPLRVDWRGASRRWEDFLVEPLTAKDLSLPDILSNVLLFFPFGFLLSGYLKNSQPALFAKVRKVFYVSLAGAGFSALCELWQLFLPSRTTSVLDVLANSTGALIGSVLALAFTGITDNIGKPKAELVLASYPLTLLLMAVLAIQFTGLLIPFDVSIDIGDLKENLKRANLQPFGNHTFQGLPTTPFSCSQFLEHMCLFAFIGWLWGICARWEWNARGFRTLGLHLATISLLALGEFLQLIVRSRTFDVNGILSRISGFMFGYLAFLAWWLVIRRRDRASITRRQALHFLFVPYLLLVVLTELSPFDLSFAYSSIASKWRAVEFVPFEAYYAKTSLWSLQDMFETIILALPVGLWVGWRLKNRPVWRVTSCALIAGVVLGGFLEALQLLTPSRFPGITDVMSFGIGSMAGSGCLLAWHRALMAPMKPRG